MTKRTAASLSFGVAILATMAVGCAHQSTHENFKITMSIQLGKSASDLKTDTDSLWSHWLGETNLPNGNIEIGLRQFRECQYFFEVDKYTNKFIGWRVEGTEEICRMPQ